MNFNNFLTHCIQNIIISIYSQYKTTINELVRSFLSSSFALSFQNLECISHFEHISLDQPHVDNGYILDSGKGVA